jgi:hypothetical protein
MYSDNILVDNNKLRKNLPKQSYSSNCLLNHKNYTLLSKHNISTHSLPISPEKHTSFARFIAEEKYNLQFFPSFRKTRKIIDNEKDKKKLIRNFNLLLYNMQNNYYSSLKSPTIFYNGDDEKTTVCASHSSNISLSTLSNISSTKKTKLTSTTLTHQAIGILNINKKRHIRCIERHIRYMSHDQAKSALCFILQLNSYINQDISPVRKKVQRLFFLVPKFFYKITPFCQM